MNSSVHLFLLTFLTALQAVTWSSHAAHSPSPEELLVGFRAAPDSAVSSFQPLLTDSSGNYSLGFLRVNRNQLSLSVLHVPSSVPLWSANTTRLARWADSTQLFFNGSLVLSDARTGVFWSTGTTGDRVWLSNTSNLMIQKLDGVTVLWQSFDFPSDTLVENQNFTSTMTLVSSNGLYSMRLGPNYIGLYAKFSGSGRAPGQMYLKHRALEAKADIVEGQPIYLVLKSGGYLGMFQNGSIPVDVQSFNTFQQNVSGIRRVRIEPDGNLKGYYWTGSSWILDYQAISDPCELPSSCGSYGLCKPGKGCSCLENRTAHDSGDCAPPGNQLSGDFCDYPVQTVVAVGDETKVGYFKVREGVGKKKVETWVGLGLGLLFGAILVFGGVVGLGWYKWRSRGVKGYLEEEGVSGVGPYKDLGGASFRSIELCEK
ncbi:UNVERIFIED_CONTAM: PAN domain-containing protein [Sesamum latifolium]|uniref:PAN domain-containing protein n=1 Tax=Sesamum latifolium TaxID=2727402 RepID=A0AAW2U0N7_9LAMI